MSEPGTDRRGLLVDGARLAAAGIVAAGVACAAVPAAAAASTGTAWTTGATSPGGSIATPPDSDQLAGLLQVEGVMAGAYALAISSGTLTASSLALANELLGHERAHAAALRRELRALGGAELPLQTTPAGLQVALATHHVKVDFAKIRTERQWLRLLADVEDVLERNYHQALTDLRRRPLMTLCAEIVGSEAQHSALLGELLSPHDVDQAVPNAFVNGY
jgi:hypothetical protein